MDYGFYYPVIEAVKAKKTRSLERYRIVKYRWSVLVYGFATLLGGFFYFKDGLQVWILYQVLLTSSLLFSLGQYYLYHLRVPSGFRKEFLLNLIYNLGLFISTLMLLYSGLTNLVMMIALLFLGWRLSLWMISKRTITRIFQFKQNGLKTSRMFRALSKYGLTNIVGFGFLTLDSIVVYFIIPEMNAFYQALFRLLMLGMLVAEVLSVYMIGGFQRSNALLMIKRYRWMMLLVLVLGLTLLNGADEWVLVLLYDERYYEILSYFPLLSLLIFARFMMAYSGTLLTLYKRHNIRLQALYYAVGIYMFITYPLVDLWGLKGLLIASFLATMIGVGIQVIEMRRVVR